MTRQAPTLPPATVQGFITSRPGWNPRARTLHKLACDELSCPSSLSVEFEVGCRVCDAKVCQKCVFEGIWYVVRIMFCFTFLV